METTGDRIRRYRAAKGMTLDDLAKACGVSAQTIFKYEKGLITNIPLKKVALLAQALGCQEADIVRLKGYNGAGLEPVPEMQRVPMLGAIACGVPALAVQEDGYAFVPENISCDFVLRCRGDSMIDAGIHDGDIVYIRQQPTVEDGEIAAVVVGDEATLKRVYTSDTVITLMPCNTQYKPLVYAAGSRDDIRIVGKAVGYTHAI